MVMFDDTLQVCTRHRMLQTLEEPCAVCLEEILKEKAKRLAQQEKENANLYCAVSVCGA
jgi:hypothetical protein